jgi:hypothetical protein
MAALVEAETSVLIRAKRCHLPEDDNHQLVACLNEQAQRFPEITE